jgi:hypothetical protein
MARARGSTRHRSKNCWVVSPVLKSVN